MRFWFDWIMNRRAARLAERLRPWILKGSRVADIGSGTGHNARVWRMELGATVDEFDVADLHWVGAGPMIFDGRVLPVLDGTYSSATVLFVLHYSPHAIEFLKEIRRVSINQVVVIQSTYSGSSGRIVLRLREFLWGPVAFYLARIAGLVRGQSCPLKTHTLFSRQELIQLFQRAGLKVLHWEPEATWGLRISRDLYILIPATSNAICPLSSPHAMKCSG